MWLIFVDVIFSGNLVLKPSYKLTKNKRKYGSLTWTACYT